MPPPGPVGVLGDMERMAGALEEEVMLLRCPPCGIGVRWVMKAGGAGWKMGPSLGVCTL